MSEEAQEQELAVDAQPVPNEAETQDDEVETPEAEEEQTDEESGDSEGEKEPTIEERVVELEKQRESDIKQIGRQKASYTALQKAHETTLQELRDTQSKLQSQEPLKEPVIDDFETMEDYQKARDEFVSNQAKQEAVKEFQEQNLQAQANQIAQERAAIANKQEAEYITSNPEYALSKAEFDNFVKASNVNPHVERAIVDQAFKGNVPQLIDYFGKNGGENIGQLQEISAMSPVEAGIEIFKIQQTLKAPEKPETKPLPKPVEKPKGGGKPRKDLAQGDVLVNLGLKEA